MDLLNTSQAAEALKVSPRRVLALISDGRLPAQKIGRDYLIKRADLELVKDRKPGRPPLAKPAAAKRAKGRKK